MHHSPNPDKAASLLNRNQKGRNSWKFLYKKQRVHELGPNLQKHAKLILIVK
jgi:hypothetical protein